MSERDPEQDEIERWLDALGGRGDAPGDDAEAARIRRTVLRQQHRFEEEIDDLRMRRGRDRLLAAVRSSREPPRGRDLRYWGLAASVALVFAASSLLLLDDADEYADGEIKSIDGSVLVPEEPATVTIDVPDVAAAAETLARGMRDAGLSFERGVEADGSPAFTVVLEDDEDVRVFSGVLSDYPAPAILTPGSYRIRLQ